MEFEWYTVIKESIDLEQGDLIPECPIAIPPANLKVGDEPDIDIMLIDSIIMSQSCDLINNKLQFVLVCPYIKLHDWIESLPSSERVNKKQKDKHIDNLRKGHLPSYHLLNKYEDLKIEDYLVVDFKNVYGIHINNLKEIAGDIKQRTRLLPPYREHLSQAFARYFMRVGLPQDIVIEGY